MKIKEFFDKIQTPISAVICSSISPDRIRYGLCSLYKEEGQKPYWAIYYGDDIMAIISPNDDAQIINNKLRINGVDNEILEVTLCTVTIINIE